MNKLVTLISAQASTEIEKRDGGKYTGALLIYTDSEGQIQKKGIHQNFIKNNPGLVKKIQDLEVDEGAGKQVVLQMEKNDQGYWNLLDILPPSEAGKSTSYSGSSNYNSGGGGKQVTNRTEETARVARQVAIQASATLEGTRNGASHASALATAEAFAAFILAPLSVDTMGKPLSTDTKDEEVTKDVPFNK